MTALRIAIEIAVLYGGVIGVLVIYTMVPHQYWPAVHFGLVGSLVTVVVAEIWGADDGLWALTFTAIMASAAVGISRYGRRQENLLQHLAEEEICQVLPFKRN
ncbi:MAG TPA: hypothetical protein VIK37_02750 [Candidatus Saccharimonadales bacterium]